MKPKKELETRIVGIDFGLARIGVALSDAKKIIAMPLLTIQTERQSLLTVQKLIIELSLHAEQNSYLIQEIVVGMPLLMSGKKGILADEVTHFIELFKKESSIPVVTWDERLTSVQAERSLRESNMSRKKRTRYVDQVAATIILQSYLESLGGKAP